MKKIIFFTAITTFLFISFTSVKAQKNADDKIKKVLYFNPEVEPDIDEIKAEWKDQLGGIVHQDGTCRVQTVTSTFNPEFYQLIGDFEAETGIGVLLNTSLNRKGMPIVETPAEALSLFLSGAIDVLVLNNFIICKHHDLLL